VTAQTGLVLSGACRGFGRQGCTVRGQADRDVPKAAWHRFRCVLHREGAVRTMLPWLLVRSMEWAATQKRLQPSGILLCACLSF
jgi:hypothetical protein